MKPKLLDLFCGAGGTTKGYQRAGFYVVGVDIKPQPHYCGDEFHQADALEFPLEGYDAYHASPPCQGYGITRNIHTCKDKDYPLLIDDIRRYLLATQRPLVIENVWGAPLAYSVMLCGLMFNLKVLRHRIFETNFYVMQPGHPYHRNIRIGQDGFCCVVAHSAVKGNTSFQYPNKKWMWEEAMNIDWMTKYELTQAIPPVYTEYIGKYLMQHIISKK
uniref:Putative methyltransferase n=1 Tax=viral metagenome TaxID=1070528 RepID=A0A6M3J315_9ZZZZ